MRNLLRADLDALPDYTPAHVPDPRRVIKLDSNENPYGPSPRVLARLAETRTWQYYFGQDDLREALANYVGVKAENLVITNGGDESIDLVLRAVLEPGDTVIDAPPSFEMYRIAALANRGRCIDVARNDDFSVNLDTVCRAAREMNAKAIALASPNNPDGGILPRADLLRLLELPTLVLLDEAYFEFAGESAVDLVPQHPNLVIVRTFSKWAALASLRVGYIIASPEFARALHKLRAPYNVNWAGLVAAYESLNDVDYLMNNVRATTVERERMRAALTQMGWLDPLPSYTNFLTMRVHGREPQQIKQALAERNILIRTFKASRLRNYIRISIGTPEMNDAVLQALREI
ncbi:MAG TPA: histidinol-phosphate transaminase [Anaerolineae bacterium]|nr:histidinol-phosphate transaminase [Anaerolineae bacterium]